MKKENAHSNIDDLILVDTLNRIAHSTDALGNRALYEAKTRGGEKRHLLQNFGGGTGKHDLEFIDYILREGIKANPTYSDTLSSKEVPGVLASMQGRGTSLFQDIINHFMGK